MGRLRPRVVRGNIRGNQRGELTGVSFTQAARLALYQKELPMPRARKPAPIASDRRLETRRYIPNDAPQALPFEPRRPAGFNQEATSVRHAMMALYQADEGTMRLTPKIDDGCWHMTYKFAWGTWRDHYVYVRVQPDEFEIGLLLLYAKVREVWQGERKPTRDRHQNFE